MKSGIELIAEERQEQIEKHGFSVDSDKDYKKKELVQAANFCLVLAESKIKIHKIDSFWPDKWDLHFMRKILCKSRKNQLIIAGAFLKAENDRRGDTHWDTTIQSIAAEIDRLQNTEKFK